VKDEAGAAEEDEVDETGGAVNAVSTAGDGSDLAVEALDAAVAEACRDEREDAFDAVADGSCNPLEGTQSGACRGTSKGYELRQPIGDLQVPFLFSKPHDSPRILKALWSRAVSKAYSLRRIRAISGIEHLQWTTLTLVAT
jgi:hypothetical protein